jgi:hypothetical protein
MTKPGRRRAIVFSHFHILNSPILCPVCVLVVYLTHRLLLVKRKLESIDFLFIFKGQKKFLPPVTDNIFDKTLKKVCKRIGFFVIRSHNFKMRILSSLFEAVEDEQLVVSNRFFLHVGDHKPDYHQDYIIPDLLFVNKKINKIRLRRMNVFCTRFTSEFIQVSHLLRKIFVHSYVNTHCIPLPLPPSQSPNVRQSIRVRGCPSLVLQENIILKYTKDLANPPVVKSRKKRDREEAQQKWFKDLYP